MDDHKAMVANAVLEMSESKQPRNVRFRRRGPVATNNTNRHDCRGENVDFICRALLTQPLPLWAVQKIAFDFIKSAQDELNCTYVPFKRDEYESIDTHEYTPKVSSEAQQYLHAFVTGSQPAPEKPENWDKIRYSIFESRNHKHDMEDKKLVLPLVDLFEPELNTNFRGASLFGVFDGHAGPECATYAATQLPYCLFDVEVDDPRQQLKAALSKLDERFLVRCEKEGVNSGSTAAVALIRENDVDFAWIGDSAVGVMTDTSVETLTQSHNLSDPSEVQRVEDCGGCIIEIYGERRVNGVLNITRALGDPGAKSLVEGHTEPVVSSVADTGHIHLADKNYYMLFLASDGVWDFADSEVVFDYVVRFINKYDHSCYKDLATYIGKKIQELSCDNLMLIILFLKPVEEIWRHFEREG